MPYSSYVRDAFLKQASLDQTKRICFSIEKRTIGVNPVCHYTYTLEGEIRCSGNSFTKKNPEDCSVFLRFFKGFCGGALRCQYDLPFCASHF